jgi:release factor glutamine methyltransferase
MPASPSIPSQSVIVSRLRAAGCVFAEDEARLLSFAARTAADLTNMVERRAAGQPLEHVIGWAEFCGLRIAVDPGVFVPRRRTEFLVRQAVVLARQGATAEKEAGTPGRRAVTAEKEAAALGRQAAGAGAAPGRQADTADGEARTGPSTVVVDLCCGSGALGAALVAVLDEVELHAADIDPAAVRCARRNVAAAGQVYEGDLYDPLPAALRGRVGILVANVPYVPTEEIGLLPAEARVHEARVALDGGADGLDALRRVAAAAASWLAPGGHLLVEASERQAPAAVETVARGGLIPRLASSEELNATVVIGTRPARQSGPG